MILSLLASLALAQTVPPGRYATLHTEHFRIHHPVRARAFAIEVASRIESMHERVGREVGRCPERRMDVVIVEPDGRANGEAIADGRFPRMRLYAAPPPADAPIGHHRDWVESLIVHEDTHLVHLTWPSRNPLERALQSVIGVGPLALKSPPWLAEGYATLIEGRLTGAGRPNDDARAAWMRQLARAGRFPDYGDLSGTARHRGFETPYLVGSAFLEWLDRSDTGRLPDLWTRMSSRRRRSFEEAFAGVYGEAPIEAYGRFVAEVMAEAWPSDLEDPSTRTATVSGYFGAPDVSPDGTRVLVPMFPRSGLPRLVVYDTAVPEDLEERRDERIEALLDADPEDVPARPPPFTPRPVDAIRFHLGRVARHARFLDDDTVLFDAWTPDSTGRMRPDLFVWEMADDTERRITRRGDVLRPDPAPDGTWAVAVRRVWGETQIVEVELATGDTTSVTPLSLAVQVDAPRVTPDGRGLVWLENRGDGYGWVFFDRETGARREHPTTLAGPQLRNLAFGPDDRLYAEVAFRGTIAVHELGPFDAGAGPADVGAPRYALPGGALAPDIAPDGAAWALSPLPDGTALHRIPPDAPIPRATSLSILKRADDEAQVPPAERRIGFRRPYGLGHWTWIPLAGFGVGTSGQGQGELALVGGDVMGRYSAEGWVSATGDGRGVTGASVRLGVRGANRTWRLTGFLGRDRRFDVRRGGVALVRSGSLRLGPGAGVRGSLGGVVERVDLGGPGRTRLVGAAGLGLGLLEARRRRLGAHLDVHGQVGRTGDRPWAWVRGGGSVRVGRELPLLLTYAAGVTTGESVLDQWTHGGAAVSVWPSEATATWITDPAFPALRQRGTRFDRLDIALGPWQLRGFATRTRVGEGFGSGGWTVVGLRGGTTVDSDPFTGVVADGRGLLGVGRTIEDPDGGWSVRGGQWVAFASWTWR